MHASIDELLRLRDEAVVDASITAHVRACGECAAELDRLRAVTAELRALPMAVQAPDRWGRIETALALGRLETPPTRGRRPGWAIPLAAAATVLVVVAALNWQSAPLQPPLVAEATPFEFAEPLAPALPRQTETEAPASATPAPDLAARSRQLEQVLAALPAPPSVMRAGTALTLAELQDRIRWVDYRLALGEEAGYEPRQSEQLWQERVDLLNSLVAVRYAQTRAAF